MSNQRAGNRLHFGTRKPEIERGLLKSEFYKLIKDITFERNSEVK